MERKVTIKDGWKVLIAGMVVDATGTFDLAYIISAVLLAIAFILALLTKPIASPKEA